MVYSELNLKKIREAVGLDFAHYTFKKGMCSCCYGPRDLPKMYWSKKTIPDHEMYTYILFKNAENGRGTVTGASLIKNNTFIEWRMSMEQLDKVCEMLSEQLGDEYVVLKPMNDSICIEIITYAEYLNGYDNKHYIAVK